MSKLPTLEMIGAEAERLSRAPSWELRNIIRALSFHPHMNSAEESARLQGAKAVIAQRALAARQRADVRKRTRDAWEA